MEKSLEEIIFIVEESPEGEYAARALGFGIFTEANGWDRLRHQVVDAVRCHFGDASSVPRLIRLHLVKDEVLAA